LSGSCLTWWGQVGIGERQVLVGGRSASVGQRYGLVRAGRGQTLAVCVSEMFVKTVRSFFLCWEGNGCGVGFCCGGTGEGGGGGGHGGCGGGNGQVCEGYSVTRLSICLPLCDRRPHCWLGRRRFGGVSPATCEFSCDLFGLLIYLKINDYTSVNVGNGFFARAQSFSTWSRI
jgi:hypothetical protein